MYTHTHRCALMLNTKSKFPVTFPMIFKDVF